MIYVISLFEHSLKLELAINELEAHKIPKESILAKSVKKISQEKKYLDPFNADGLNFFIVSMIGMICMLIGTIYGFVLYLGPILYGLMGLFFGVITGLAIDFYYKKVKRVKTIRKNTADVMLLVKCEQEKVEMVEEILRNHHTLGMIRV
jgi:hypothetical protein